jgi:putative membrane protein
MAAPLRDKPGLQRERTELSWERTALGFIAIGGALLLRGETPLSEGRTLAAALSLLIALAVAIAGRRRARHMPAAAGRSIAMVGVATLGLAVLVSTILAAGWALG